MSGTPTTEYPNAVSWLAQRCDGVSRRLDGAVETLEQRLGGWGAALVCGILLMAIAALYCAPAEHLVNHGILYGDFSRDPFHESLTSPIRLRPLSPVIAYLLFLRGPAFMAFPLIVAAIFLGLLVRTARKNGYGGGESLAMASLMAFTSPILFTLHFAGYVDVVSYLFVAVAVAGAGSDLVVAACICLALLNHDANLFLLPWLLFHTARRRPSWARRVKLFAAIGAALVVVVLVRNAIAARAPVTWAPSFYLNVAYLKENALLNVRGTWLGLFMVFKLAWLIPVFAAIDLAVKKKRLDLFDLLLAAGCGLATMIITSDASRLPALAFPAVLGGAAVLRGDVLRPPRFARALWVLVALNFFVPQYYVGQSHSVVFFPLPVALVLKACGYDPWDDWLADRKMHFSQE
jgi:hypothetical protein